MIINIYILIILININIIAFTLTIKFTQSLVFSLIILYGKYIKKIIKKTKLIIYLWYYGDRWYTFYKKQLV